MVLTHDYRRSGHRAGMVHVLAANLAAGRPGTRADFAAELGGFLASFDRGRDGFWTLIDGGTPAGCIALDGHEAGRATLRWWHVVPRLRGQGLGTALLGLALQRAAQLGTSTVEVEPGPVSPDAQRLLEAAGFRFVPDLRGRARWRRVAAEHRLSEAAV